MMLPEGLDPRLRRGLAASVACCLLIVAVNPNERCDLRDYYDDHHRHATVAWMALSAGGAVYTTPYGELLADHGPPGAADGWEAHTYLYPPGALALFAPAGIAIHGLGLPPRLVHKAMIALLVVGAHLAVAWLAVAIAGMGPAAQWILLPIFWSEAARWALNGFYDPVAVAVSLAGLVAWQRGRAARAALWLAASFFLHYRAVYLAPVGLLALAAAAPRWRSDPSTRRQLAAAIALAVVAAVALVVGMIHCGEIPESNRASVLRVGYNGTVVTLFAVGAAAAIGLRALGAPLGALLAFFVTACLLATVQTQWWHPLALAPVIVCAGLGLEPGATSRRPQDAVGLLLLWAFVMIGPVYRAYPDLRWLTHAIEELLFG